MEKKHTLAQQDTCSGKTEDLEKKLNLHAGPTPDFLPPYVWLFLDSAFPL
jgi:hypothetical protein